MRHKNKKQITFSKRLTPIFLIVTLLSLFTYELSASASNTASSSPAIAVDYAGRQNQSHAIPSDFLGLNDAGLENIAGLASPYITQANVHVMRTWSNFSLIFPSKASMTDASQQWWPAFDAQIDRLRALGVQPLIVLHSTPTWLQPAAKTCAQYHVSPVVGMPTLMVNGVNQGPGLWGQLAAQMVNHMYKTYPGLNPLYEIWNEPDSVGSFCLPTADRMEMDRLAAYKTLYAAVGPKMRQMAQQDHIQVRIGGPALSYPLLRAGTWLPSLLSDTSITPYVDFVSAHIYMGKSHPAWSDLLAATQDPTKGAEALYEQIASYVRAGKQANAAATPIYIDEYNTNVHTPDCCRNDTHYSPIWNTLFVSDMLNAVLDTHSPSGPARALPIILYWAASSLPDTTCMFGTYNSAMNCSLSGPVQPYPSYYAYQLLGGTNYLDISNGGYVAASASSSSANLVVTGFYTKTKDSLVIVNTSGQNYTNVTVTLQHPNITNTRGSEFLLNQSHLHINTQAVTLTAAGNADTATIAVPPYSTVALALPTT